MVRSPARCLRQFVSVVILFILLRSLVLYVSLGPDKTAFRTNTNPQPKNSNGASRVGPAEATTKSPAQPQNKLIASSGRRTTPHSRLDSAVGQNVSESECVNMITRPSTVRTRNEVWQYTRDGQDEVIVYSAFFDERLVASDLPAIQILAITRLKQLVLYCHVWYAHVTEPYVVAAVVHRTGRGDKVDNLTYGQHQLTCPLPALRPIPSHVSVTISPCANSTILLPVHPMTASPWQHEFGVCVAIAFGSVPAPVIVEWIEMHRLFGVTEFNIYEAYMVNMSSVFSYYEQAGILRVHHMPPPIDSKTYKSIKLSSPASLNDCMMKNMYRYRFTLILDFDEFIIPRLHDTYHDLIAAIDAKDKRNESHHTYSVRNTYFFRDLPPDQSQPGLLRTMQYRKRASPSRRGFGPKSFVDPRKCFSVFNHYCYIQYPNSGLAVDVDTKLALSHHYRNCNFNNKTCENYYRDQHQDDITLVYKLPLKSRVSNVLQSLNISVS